MNTPLPSPDRYTLEARKELTSSERQPLLAVHKCQPLPDRLEARKELTGSEPQPLPAIYKCQPLPDSYTSGDFHLPAAQAKSTMISPALAPVSKHVGNVVTQESLTEFARLQPLVARFKALQKQIKSALDKGVSVEPGALEATYHVRQKKQLCVSYMIGRLGLTKEQVADLRSKAPATLYRYLTVRPSKRRSTRKR